MQSNIIEPIDYNTSKPFCKELSRLDISISNYAFDSKVIWCRVAFNNNETLNQAQHSHSFYELHLCLSGSASFRTKSNDILTITSGEFVLFPPKQSHQLIDVTEDFSKLVFGFTLELKESEEYIYLKSSFDNITQKVFVASQELKEMPSKILNIIKRRPKCYKLLISNILAMIIVECGNCINPYNEATAIRYIDKDRRLESLILYMQDNLSRTLTTEDLATQANLSSKQLNRLMQQTYGMTVSDYFKKERIKKARYLLTHTELSMEQIAHKIGFSDEFSMAKAFKRIEGMSPSKYRSSFFLK